MGFRALVFFFFVKCKSLAKYRLSMDFLKILEGIYLFHKGFYSAHYTSAELQQHISEFSYRFASWILLREWTSLLLSDFFCGSPRLSGDYLKKNLGQNNISKVS